MNNVLTFLNHMATKNFIIRQYKYYIIDSIIIVKNQGFKELFRQRGIKFLVIIITYYAIRDTILYIIIPLLVAKGLL
jgi:hypothetical protein